MIHWNTWGEILLFGNISMMTIPALPMLSMLNQCSPAKYDNSQRKVHIQCNFSDTSNVRKWSAACRVIRWRIICDVVCWPNKSMGAGLAPESIGKAGIATDWFTPTGTFFRWYKIKLTVSWFCKLILASKLCTTFVRSRQSMQFVLKTPSWVLATEASLPTRKYLKNYTKWDDLRIFSAF